MCSGQHFPLIATRFGLFISSLHYHLQVSVPHAGVQLQDQLLADLEYAGLPATSSAHLQAFIEAIAADGKPYIAKQTNTAKTASTLA